MEINMVDKILVLDVDETLVNMEPLSFLKIFKKNYSDYEGRLMFGSYYLSPRPNLMRFLNEASKLFKLVAFSVADKEATIKKLGSMGILNKFVKVYGREDLVNGKKSFKKIADDLNVNMENITAVDDVPEYYLEKERVIRIEPWFIGGNKDDNALLKILDNLKYNIAEVLS